MFSYLILFALVAFAFGDDTPAIVPIPGGLSGDGVTTRYWDCCKPSCSWSENLPNKTKTPVRSCEIDGTTTIDREIQSGCGEGGKSYMCIDQTPIVINKTLSYGFAAFSYAGGAYEGKCCSCMLLRFQGQLSGKMLLIQVTNTGEDLNQNHFDLAMPGGGVGIYNGCTVQWNAPKDGWGDRYGGVHTIEECEDLPKVLQAGCKWRFTFMEGVPNPAVKYEEVQCPKKLTDLTGCLP